MRRFSEMNVLEQFRDLQQGLQPSMVPDFS